ncbi:hypothetical protein ABDK75_17510 [Gluconobacter sp. OJA]
MLTHSGGKRGSVVPLDESPDPVDVPGEGIVDGVGRDEEVEGSKNP